MQSEIDLLKQHINELEARNVELETENAEIPELRKKLAEIPELRKKLAEVEARNAELIEQIMEENNRRDAKIEDTTDRVAKLEQKQLQNDNTEDEKMDAFLVEVSKKSIGDNIRKRNKEKKIRRESESSREIEVNEDEDEDKTQLIPEDSLQLRKGIAKASSYIKTVTTENSEKFGKSNMTETDTISLVEEPKIDSAKDKTESTTKQSSQSLTSSSMVTEFVQGLLEELLSSGGQLLEPIKFSPPRILIPGSISIKRLANLFCQSVVARKNLS